jgi:replicative DNA helicase
MNDAKKTSPNSDPAAATQPHDPSAERAVLGALLLRPSAIQDIGTKLAPEDFYLESHRCIYRAMLSVDEAGEPIDAVLVLKRLRELDLVEVAGGGAYLAQLGGAVPSAANVEHYAGIVKAAAVQRSVLAYATSVAQRARGEVEDVAVLVDEVAREAMTLSTQGIANRTVHIRDALEPALDMVERLMSQGNKGGVTGVPSGFHLLDRKTAGWQPSDLIILAARPGMGKTAFALNLLVNAAKDKRNRTPGVIFSMEMSKEQLATRIWCAEARVPMDRFRTGDLNNDAWGRLLPTIEDLSKLGIYIDDTPALPISEMMRKCRQLKQQHQIGLIVVDYLQLMTASASGKMVSREQQISEISRNLKALAKELHVPIIALSQLNRSVEGRQDKRPMLSDLRESGAIEQDADIITFLYRDSYYEQMKGGSDGGAGGDEQRAPVRAPGAPSATEVIIAKHRSGETGKVELLFHPSYTLFTNQPTDGPPPPESPNP